MLGRSGTRLLALPPFAIGFWFGVKFILGVPILMRGSTHWFADHLHHHPNLALIFFTWALVSYLAYGLTSWFYRYISARMMFPRIVEGVIESVRAPGSRALPAFASVILVISSNGYRARMRNLGALHPDAGVGRRVRLGVGPVRFRTAYFIELKD
jgi:hypothetical protein